MYSDFKFFAGKLTLQEYLHKWGYEKIWDLEQVSDYFDQLEWYNWVVMTFNYKKEEDIEYQEYLRKCDEEIINHVNPIHYDENGEELPF
jgi:hypothetical protein